MLLISYLCILVSFPHVLAQFSGHRLEKQRNEALPHLLLHRLRSRIKMSAPFWETVETTFRYTFLQWKRVKLHCLSFLQSMVFRVSSKDIYVESIDCRKRWTTHLHSLPLKKSEAAIVPIGRGHIALIWDPGLRSSERSWAASCSHSCWVDCKHMQLKDFF